MQCQQGEMLFLLLTTVIKGEDYATSPPGIENKNCF